MITYRDMTFCRNWGDCSKGKECRRAYTAEVEARALKSRLPIAWFSKKPDCHQKNWG